jgi:DNA polymerase-3 subunit alpha
MRKSRLTNVPDFHVHSHFSILDGQGTPKQVVERAKELGWGAACLTEHGWLGSAPSFYQACRAEKINPIIGCEMYIVPENLIPEGGKKGEHSHHLTVLALSCE